jgi:GTP-binding protein
MADIPGLVPGAAEGAGLGIRFLRHLARTRLLLHLVDIAPLAPSEDPAQAVRTVGKELKKFSPVLAARERWLVCNKIDLLSPEQREVACRRLRERLDWRGPLFMISAASRAGTPELMTQIMNYLETHAADSSATG